MKTMLILSAAMLASATSYAGSIWVPDDHYYSSHYRSSETLSNPTAKNLYWVDSAGTRVPVYRDRDTRELVVPSRVLSISLYDGDRTRLNCTNVYEILGQANRCGLSREMRRGIAEDFYRVGRNYLDSTSTANAQYIDVGPDVRLVMGCLRSSRTEPWFIDCLGLG